MGSPDTAEQAGPLRAQDIEAIVAQHEAALLRYATRILNDPAAAQDVVQDVFIKLFRNWRDGAHPAPQLKGWLFRVTHNRAVDHIRRESRLRILHWEQARRLKPSCPPEQGQDLQQQEAMRLALQHLRKLDPAEQQIVILRLQEGMSYREIAEITKKSEGHVGFILHHAVKKLSRSLRDAGVIRGVQR